MITLAAFSQPGSEQGESAFLVMSRSVANDPG
jgi:hypothetical protein